MDTKKYGLKFDIPSAEHYVFGASPIPMDILQSDGDWTPYLPTRELQSRPNIETYACVVYTLLNCLEILIKKIYNEERNYSERFLATILETGKKGGSSPQEACEFLRKLGVVADKTYPFDESITTVDEYFKELSPILYELAKEFNEEWEFLHDNVPLTNECITRALKCSPLMISVYAWIKNEKGLYYRPEGVGDVHATTMIYERVGEFRRVFDTYLDNDGGVIKDYDWNSMPMIAKRFYIKKKHVEPIKNTADIGSAILNFFSKVWAWCKEQRKILRIFRRSLNE